MREREEGFQKGRGRVIFSFPLQKGEDLASAELALWPLNCTLGDQTEPNHILSI